MLDARLDIYSVTSEKRAAISRRAVVRIDEAQRLAGQLDQDANAVAADAAQIIVDVLGRMPKR